MQKYKLNLVVQGSQHEIDIVCEYKKRKNLMLRVYPKTAQVLFSIPYNTPKEYALAFLQKQKRWIENQLEKVLPYLVKHDYLTGDSFYFLGEKIDLVVKKGSFNKAEICGKKIILTQKIVLTQKEKRQLIEKMFYKSASNVMLDLVEHILPRFEKLHRLSQRPRVKLRKMESKWGICRPLLQEITLSKRLIHLPKELIEYVIVHELCHFKHMNHGKDFWLFVGQLVPDYKEKRRLLNQVDIYMTSY